MSLVRVKVSEVTQTCRQMGLPVAYKQDDDPHYVLLAYDRKDMEGPGWQEPDLGPAIRHAGGGYYDVFDGGSKKRVKGEKAARDRVRKSFKVRS